MELKQLRKQRGLSQQAVADRLGVARSTVAMWETGASQPGHAATRALADLLGVSIDALLGYDGGQGVMVPVLGYVRAGIPVTAVQEVLDYEEISRDMAESGDFFALRIQGDSMQPRMDPDDVVIVRRQEDVESGQIAIVLVNGDDATCKKVIKHPAGISLVSFNPAYPPMFYAKEEIASLPVTIVGRVMELRAKF
ncbi:MAG: LexA family protein [Christensenellales bacterium]